jgi:hypothetical protein
MHKLNGPISTKVLSFILLAVFSSAMVGVRENPSSTSRSKGYPVVQQDVPVYCEWVATFDGYVNAQVRPQVSGYVIR